MYYPDYNPTIHDIYLYGPGNTGFPIAINPNSLIAGASADFVSVGPRYRRFDYEILPPPPGLPLSLYPNYYNANIPLYTVISDKIIGLNSHYTANKPSDFGPYGVIGGGLYSKYTGTTTAFPYLSLGVWNEDWSGISYYGPFTGFYNFLPENLLPSGYSGCSFAKAFYFTGSPEIFGFSGGNTFYCVLNPDNSFANLMDPAQSIETHPIKIISPYEVLTENQKSNFSDYCYALLNPGYSEASFSYLFPTENLYFWDGNDKIIPTDYFAFSFQFKNIGTQFLSGIPINFYVECIFMHKDAKIDVGDSSGQLVYLKNNKLYFIGSALAVSSVRITQSVYPSETQAYPSVVFPAYQYALFPNLQGLTFMPLNRTKYSTTLNAGLTLATKIDFDRTNNLMENIINTLTNLRNTI